MNYVAYGLGVSWVSFGCKMDGSPMGGGNGFAQHDVKYEYIEVGTIRRRYMYSARVFGG